MLAKLRQTDQSVYEMVVTPLRVELAGLIEAGNDYEITPMRRR